jgi:hypothetical protein
MTERKEEGRRRRGKRRTYRVSLRILMARAFAVGTW